MTFNFLCRSGILQYDRNNLLMTKAAEMQLIALQVRNKLTIIKLRHTLPLLGFDIREGPGELIFVRSPRFHLLS